MHAPLNTLDELAAVLADSGNRLYGGEAVSQLAHALQGAQAAEQDGASSALIVATLLHDLCLLYTSPSPRDATLSRMPSSA